MDKQEIIRFFDLCAPWWDSDMIRNEAVIDEILTQAGVKRGICVLDVACGTGVLFPDYLARGVERVTGVDISPEMVKIAQSKYPQIPVVCGDVEQVEFEGQFDVVMVYNAFPHFPDPKALVARLAQLTKVGGRLCVAHSMSREELLRHHEGRAGQVSIALPEVEELALMFEDWFAVDVAVSDARMYQVCGVRKSG